MADSSSDSVTALSSNMAQTHISDANQAKMPKTKENQKRKQSKKAKKKAKKQAGVDGSIAEEQEATESSQRHEDARVSFLVKLRTPSNVLIESFRTSQRRLTDLPIFLLQKVLENALPDNIISKRRAFKTIGG